MKRTQPPIIYIAILIGLLVACGLLFYLAASQITLANKTEAAVKLLAQNQAKLVELSDSLPQLAGIARSWSGSLPANESEVAIFASRIEQIANSQKLVFSLNFDDFPGPVEVNGVNIIGLGASITLEGSFTAISNFLTALSDLPYFFKTDRLTLTKRDSGPGVKTIINGALMLNIMPVK